MQTVDQIKNAVSRRVISNTGEDVFKNDLSDILKSIADRVTVTVKDYGAMGDGATDDYVNIQKAIDAVGAAGGGTVLFTPGTYKTSATLNVTYPNIRLLGDSATLLSFATTNGAKVYVTASNFTADGLVFDGAHVSGGAVAFGFGLLDIVGTSAVTAVDNHLVTNCRFQNSQNMGLRILGNVTNGLIQANTFAANFLGIYAEKYSSTTIFSGIKIVDNTFRDAWYTSTFSGAIKIKGAAANSLSPSKLQISRNKISACGEMGIELFDNCSYCDVLENEIISCAFGVSCDNANNVKVGSNNVSKCSTIGLEIANACTDMLYANNVVDCYSSGTTKAGSYGIAMDNSTSTRCSILNNKVKGCAGYGIGVTAANLSVIEGNSIYDCDQLLNIKATDRTRFIKNALYAPCSYHIFCDYNNQSGTDIEIDGNYFYGTASVDNIIMYDNLLGRTLTNLKITNNNAIAANYTNLTINGQMSTPNLQVYGNHYLLAAAHSDFTDQASNLEKIPPYAVVAQKAGISVSTKRIIAVSSAGTAQWFKVVSFAYGRPMLMQMHVLGYNAGVTIQNALTAFITASPYGQDSGIALMPSSNYLGGIVDEIIYNNPASGSTQEVWIKVRVMATAGTLECHFSDYLTGVVASPTPVTTEPTWAANYYKAKVEVSYTALQSTAFFCRQFIASANKDAMTTLGARLHIRGKGVNGSPSDTRIARFDLDDTTEAVAIDDTGILYANKKLSVGGGGGILNILTNSASLNFGTVLAGAGASVGLSVTGAATTNNPAVSIGWGGGLPLGIVPADSRVSAANTVNVAIFNPTAASIVVGSISVRATVIQY